MIKSVALSILFIGIVGCSQAVGSRVIPGISGPAALLSKSSKLKTIVTFNGFNGCTPYAGVVAQKDILYGTTTCGGRFGEGDVYSVTTSGKFKILHSFSKDARYAYAPVIAVGNALYGTAVGGGKYHDGTVYSLTLSGKERWVYSFNGGGDVWPYGGLANVNGTLYGTTLSGGTGYCYFSGPGCGTVFKIARSGKKESTVYSFQGGNDGEHPWVGLVNVNGTLYGAAEGGQYNSGTVFSVTPAGAEHVLHSFGGLPDGDGPYGSLIYANGLLYGTTQHGGYFNEGCVYSITTSGTEKVVYSFGSRKYDAMEPQAGLLYYKGALYGTTPQGGGQGNCDFGCGTVYKVSTSGKEQVVYAFTDGADGGGPLSQLTAVGRALYGTTQYGGNSYYGWGTVFALTP